MSWVPSRPMSQTYGPTPVHLQGRWVVLEPLRRDHIESIHCILAEEPMTLLWPRSHMPSFELRTLENHIWQMATLQYAVRERSQGRVIGLMQGTDESPRDRTIGLGIVMDSSFWRRGWPVEALLLFLDFLFEVRGYRKVYFEMLDSTRRRAAGILDLWTRKEVTFTRHHRNSLGEYEDWHVFSMGHRDWDPTLVERLGLTRR